ncbi:MAG: Wzz/FepE/Etk N-terminal domain-containing protein [Bacteroidetes bacterium]|nr:Wzz/FepE/Etk N-terminal domain-containing protein [Rhodothermia bacterium]MCS7154884.1 Wzz/FepE/Etk N-terminal domain-containing protein [Bacteroidota bacterium]MCX7906958.1 Wzz/FepE/Etk N-terminal domain-containing protein [Bacteroidota bacterium]MDW8137678.1 Wzz/FepE/Etk N-terminal domain-containing protein [Bacteroidota bacterium]MDW8285368.1 Wzz/FepE/Etk N-terminal domain-containing protein [Bacteroidota bacterium]
MKTALVRSPILYGLAVLYRRRWLLIGATLAAAALSALISLLLPNYYKATATVLPSQAGGLRSLSAALPRDLAALASSLGGFGLNTDFDRYYAILNSRRAKWELVRRFNLMDVYRTRHKRYPVTATLKKLERNMRFGMHQEGYFEISIWDQDPRRAAEMANYCVELLNRINTEIATTEARAYREFIETRYRKAQADLDSLQRRLSVFQRRYGIYDLPSQLGAYFSTIADISAELYRLEVQRDALRAGLGADNPLLGQLEEQIRATRAKLSSLRQDTGPIRLMAPLRELPEVNRAYLELMRELTIQAKIQEVIVPLYEQAKVEEQRTTPTVIVLDRAEIPERKDHPRRTIIVLAATVSVFVLAVFFALAYDPARRRWELLRASWSESA